MTCPTSQFFGDYLSADLSAAQLHEFEEHLQECPNCRRLLAEERQLDGLLRSQALVAAPADFGERLMAALAAPRPARPYPEWLWALGLGSVVATVGLLVGKLGSGAIQSALQKIQALIGNLGLAGSSLKTPTLPGADWLTQFAAVNSVLLINLAVGAAILCWGLWQMVKALRR